VFKLPRLRGHEGGGGAIGWSNDGGVERRSGFRNSSSNAEIVKATGWTRSAQQGVMEADRPPSWSVPAIAPTAGGS
jgi:hypothetical protein